MLALRNLATSHRAPGVARCPAEHITGCTLRRLRRASLMCDKVVFCTTKYLLSLITTGPPNYRQPTQIHHSYHNHHLSIQNSTQNHFYTRFTQVLVRSSLSIANASSHHSSPTYHFRPPASIFKQAIETGLQITHNPHKPTHV